VIVTIFLFMPSVPARNSTSDSLAFPFSGAADNLTLSIPPNKPAIAVLLERGTTFTVKMTELPACCIFNCSICGYSARSRRFAPIASWTYFSICSASSLSDGNWKSSKCPGTNSPFSAFLNTRTRISDGCDVGLV